MNHTMTIQINNRGTITTQAALRIYFVMWWIQYTVLDFVRVVFSVLPVVGQMSDWIVPMAMAMMLLLSIPYIAKRLRYTDLLFYLVAALVVFGTMLFLPENAEYIEKDLWRILGLAVPAYFLGLCYDHETMQKDLFWCSVASVLILAAYQLFNLSSGRELEAENMDASYKVLPSVLYLFYWAFQEKKLWHWILTVVGVILVFSYGTRGPVLITAAYIAVQLFLRLIWNKRNIWRILGTIVLTTIVILLFTTSALTDFAKFMGETFEKAGLSTRIFDYYVEGEFTESVGREKIADNVRISISENLPFGIGFYGDRVVSGSYAHNIALELWCEFGVFIGSVGLLAILWTIISGLRCTKQAEMRSVFLMFVCMVCIKLMLSGTYTTEAYFFFLLGMSIQQKRNGTAELSLNEGKKL